MMKRLFVILLVTFLCTTNSLLAQSENVDFMRSIGKIYVVVAVIVISFIGMVAFLFYMEKRLTKLENQINDHGKS